MIWKVIIIIFIIVAWYWFEGRWDRRLFQTKEGQTILNLKSREARRFLEDHPETQILDVRSASECNRGVIPGSINISIGEERFSEKLDALDRSKPILVYCAGGYRSRKAVEKLRELGFSTVVNLHRGFLSWNR